MRRLNDPMVQVCYRADTDAPQAMVSDLAVAPLPAMEADGDDTMWLTGVIDGRWHTGTNQPPSHTELPRLQFDRFTVIDVAADLPALMAEVAKVATIADRRRDTERSVIVWVAGANRPAQRVEGALGDAGLPAALGQGWEIEYLCADEAAGDQLVDDVVAVVVSPAWEHGVRRTPAPYIDKIIERYGQAGALIVADESVSGFGRTGPLFASHHWSREPDLMLLGSNALNGDEDVAVMLGHEDLIRRLPSGSFSTDLELSASVRSGLSSSASVYEAVGSTGPAVEANAHALRRGLHILLEQDRIAALDGDGWSYAVTPNHRPPGAAHWTDTVDRLHRVRALQLCVPAFLDGRLLIAPPVTSGPGELARILDSLDAAL